MLFLDFEKADSSIRRLEESEKEDKFELEMETASNQFYLHSRMAEASTSGDDLDDKHSSAEPEESYENKLASLKERIELLKLKGT